LGGEGRVGWAGGGVQGGCGGGGGCWGRVVAYEKSYGHGGFVVDYGVGGPSEGCGGPA